MPTAAVKPKFARELVTRWLQEDFHDLSVSRPRSRLEWGIPVPNDDSQTVSQRDKFSRQRCLFFPPLDLCLVGCSGELPHSVG